MYTNSYPHELDLDTHATVAFAAGHELDVKSGIDIASIQKSFSAGGSYQGA